MSLTSGARLDVASRADARARLLAELAADPARKGYGIAYDLLGNRAEAEEAVQDALARACESIGDLRDPAAAPGVVPAHRDDDVSAHVAPAPAAPRAVRLAAARGRRWRQCRADQPASPPPMTSRSACTAISAPAPRDALGRSRGARRVARPARRSVAAAAHRARAALRPRPAGGRGRRRCSASSSPPRRHISFAASLGCAI